jgi:peptidyl-tRNA hydrolase, PTH1 family
MIRLFVGLGNPGPPYENTRHNAGFWWIDELAAQWGASWHAEGRYFGSAARTTREQGTVHLLKPMTYMNLSGQSVAALAGFFKISPEEILVIHDELDIPPGTAKLKQGGGHAGHNGLKDIQARLGSPNFWRLRLGIGHPGVRAEVVDYVLRKPRVEERSLMDEAVAQSLKAVDDFVRGDMVGAVRKVHEKIK